MRNMTALILAGILLVGGGCESRSEVPSGTYTGTIAEVNADETEIYVDTPDQGTLELYFTERTTLMQEGQTVEFAALKQGQTVRVEVENVEGRLDPVSVTIVPAE